MLMESARAGGRSGPVRGRSVLQGLRESARDDEIWRLAQEGSSDVRERRVRVRGCTPTRPHAFAALGVVACMCVRRRQVADDNENDDDVEEEDRGADEFLAFFCYGLSLCTQRNRT